MKTSKRWTLIPASVIILVVLAGCSKDNGMVGTATALPETTAPIVTPMATPEAAPSADATPEDTATAQPLDWTQDYGQVEGRVAMISEVDSACVLVDGGVALVGVTFDSAYQGELTQRIQQMVAGEVQAADAAIQTVGVTGDPDDVTKIQALADQVRSGNSPDDLSGQISAVLNNETTMK